LLNKKVEIIFTVLTILGILIIGIGLNFASAAVESYTKNDVIGNLTYSEWADGYWNWWISLPEKSIPSNENTGPMGGCLVKTDVQNKTIFLMNNFYVGSVQQKCSFKPDQSILIPLYVGECDTGDKDNAGKPFTELLACALDADRGEAHMKVKVDNLTLVDTKASVRSTPAHNSLTEVESKDLFDVNVPPDSQFIPSNYNGPGKFKGAAHGWYVFLKPLDEGNHVISYYTKVTGTLPPNTPLKDIEDSLWDYEADVAYNIKVEK
jgi:hypothetical protein